MEEPIVEQTTEKPIVEETTETETKVEETEVTTTDASDIEAKNRQLFERTKKAENEKKALEKEIERLKKVKTPDSKLDVSDYIDISSSLEGLDQKEKEKLSREHKLTGEALSEIRRSEDFVLWQKAYREKVEKTKALDPSTTQQEVSKPKTIEERLLEAKTLDEKAKILAETGRNPMLSRNYDVGM
jgi:hypothetical protein